MKHTKFSGQAEYQSVKDVETYLLKGVEEEQQRSLLKQAIQCADSIQDEPTHLPSSVDIAFILKKLGVEPQTLIAALLTDPRFDERLSLLDIEDQFTPSVAALTKQVNWLNTFKEPELVEHNIPDQAEALRRMLLATVNDVRAVLVRLVYRVQRLRMLGTEPRHVQYAIARETLDIYTPLRNRWMLTAHIGKPLLMVLSIPYRAYLLTEISKHVATAALNTSIASGKRCSVKTKNAMS